MNDLERITSGFSLLPMVEAVALSGSRTCMINDGDSDYDIYVYSSGPVPPERREKILSGIFPSVSISCSPFEEGDEAAGEDGSVYDLMYRSLEWTEREVDDVWRKHNARLGYTTCFIHNISTSEILFDRNGWFSALQAETHGNYPETLRKRIIGKNLSIIDGEGKATFMIQAALAWKRCDIVSMNHRLAAILASVFDIIFAYSRVLHPGEKKLMEYAHLLCGKLPENFDEDIRNAIESIGDENYVPALEKLVSDLRAFLD